MPRRSPHRLRLLGTRRGVHQWGMLSHLRGCPHPLFFWGINTNYPQTRKSELRKLLSEGGTELDRLIQQNLLARWRQAKLDAAERRMAAMRRQKSRPSIRSRFPIRQLRSSSPDWPRTGLWYATLTRACCARWVSCLRTGGCGRVTSSMTMSFTTRLLGVL